MNNTHCIILLLPHINGNETSIERFKSFIYAIKLHYKHFKIVNFQFPPSKSLFLGIDEIDKDDKSISNLYNNYLISVKPDLNTIQSVFFKLANEKNRKYVKPLIWLHQMVYGNDIFTPTNIQRLVNSLVSLEIKKGFVIACGGPFGLWSVADNLSKKLNYKLVLDYRDPYTFGFPPIDGSVVIHKIKQFFKQNSELKLLNKANLITTVSTSLKNFFPIQIHKKIFVLPNGSNLNINNALINPTPTNFNIVYAGTLYNTQLNNKVFFEALKIFIIDKDVSTINLFFLGASNNLKLKKILTKYNLLVITTITQRQTKEKMLNYMCNASCFLHLKYGYNSGVITSKQAEYLAFKKAILLPVSDFGDLAESITTNIAGEVCNSVNQTLTFLNNLWLKHINNQSLIIERRPNTIITRESIANDFITLIKSI